MPIQPATSSNSVPPTPVGIAAKSASGRQEISSASRMNHSPHNFWDQGIVFLCGDMFVVLLNGLIVFCLRFARGFHLSDGVPAPGV